jgi:hypothetical protein
MTFIICNVLSFIQAVVITQTFGHSVPVIGWVMSNALLLGIFSALLRSKNYD